MSSPDVSSSSSSSEEEEEEEEEDETKTIGHEIHLTYYPDKEHETHNISKDTRRTKVFHTGCSVPLLKSVLTKSLPLPSSPYLRWGTPFYPAEVRTVAFPRPPRPSRWKP